MALNSVYRVRMRATLLSQKVEWGFHIQQVTATGGPADLAASVAANVLPLAEAASVAATNWDEVVISDTSATGDESVHLGFTQPAPGTVTGDALPGQNTAVISLGTGLKGRRRHGRFYFPGLSEANQASGVLSGGQLTALQALANGLLNKYGPTGTETNYRLVVYSPPTPPFVAPTPPPVHTDTLITPITSTRTDPIIRTQRRRAIGVGR